MNPSNAERTNQDRAKSARLALEPFTIENYGSERFGQLHPDDQEGAIVELIGDLFHLADEMGMSRKAILKTACNFYEENIEVGRPKPISFTERVRKKQAQKAGPRL